MLRVYDRCMDPDLPLNEVLRKYFSHASKMPNFVYNRANSVISPKLFCRYVCVMFLYYILFVGPFNGQWGDWES